jgi:ribosome-binding factor A
MANDRIIRIAGEIKRALSFIIHDEIKDPRISAMASVTRVELTRDLKYAKAYVSIFDTEEKRKATMEALQHAEGFIKKALSESVQMRSMPAITFVMDDSIEYSIKISKILQEVAAKDAGRKDGDV